MGAAYKASVQALLGELEPASIRQVLLKRPVQLGEGESLQRPGDKDEKSV